MAEPQGALTLALGPTPQEARLLARRLAGAGPRFHALDAGSGLRTWLAAASYASRRSCPVVLALAPAGLAALTPAQLRMGVRVALGLAGGAAWTAPGPLAWPSPPPAALLEALHASSSPSKVGEYLLTSRPANPGPGIGAWTGAQPESVALLVSDRPSRRWPERLPNWPFISTRTDGCSAWLADHLENAGVPEHRLYWVNAYDSAGKLTNLEWARTRSWRGIVALGKEAAESCRRHGLDFQQVHHPQYWKRFQHGKRYILGRMLREL